MNSDYPRGWALCTLGDLLVEMKTGPFGSALHKADYVAGGIPVINPINIVDGNIVPSTKITISQRTFSRLSKYALQTDDLIIARRGEMGRCAVVTEAEAGFLCGTGSAVLRLNEAAFPKFMKGLISSDAVRKYLSEASIGTTMDNLNQRIFKEMTVALPPLAEQMRIVAFLDTLIIKVRSCEQRLEELPLLLTRFRQSVLAAACSGRLTADWRKCQNDPQGTEVFLCQIRERRLTATSSTKQRQVVESTYGAVEESDSYLLPPGWAFTCLNKLAESFDYGTSAKSSKKGAVPVLRMGNIQNGTIDWHDLVYTSDADEIEKYMLEPNTVLFNRTNSPELVGKTAIYRGEQPAIFAGYLIRINSVAELDPEYLNLCLNSPAAREFCQRVKTDGVSQSNINAQKLGMFEVPFCSPAEQQEIVRRAAKLFAVADQIEDRYETAKKRVEGLSQSILTKAFRGELVPTEAELAERKGRPYESAETLLQRIKAATGAGPKTDATSVKKAGRKQSESMASKRR